MIEEGRISRVVVRVTKEPTERSQVYIHTQHSKESNHSREDQYSGPGEGVVVRDRRAAAVGHDGVHRAREVRGQGDGLVGADWYADLGQPREEADVVPDRVAVELEGDR